MSKFLDNFGDELYKKIGFRNSFLIVLLILVIPTGISIFFNFLSNSKLESFRNQLETNLADYKSELDNINKKDFELFIYKKSVYSEVIRVVDKKFDSMNFHDSKPISSEPTTQEMNEVYRQLLLVTDNEEIPSLFMKFLDNKTCNTYCSPARRGEFLKLLRDDLGKSVLKMRVDSIPYYRNFKTE
jgi:hypothetical protein